MGVCPNCGQENPEIAQFCLACGAALRVGRERRRTATLLFCDVSGSTAMAEWVDAESVRDLMFRYFQEMRRAIERHGGTVEKFAGDAVMAVFGVPLAHEDDALRAVRAAWEMRRRLEELNVDFGRRFGTTIAVRVGVNTGEVVAGDGSARQMIVTGDAVNVAARLEQSAEPGEILLGELTYRLVREAVSAESTEPLTAKGKTAPLAAYRLRGISSAAVTSATPTVSAPLIGRQRELEALNGAFEQVVHARRCALTIVVGEPGVGKSRLAAEFIASLGPPTAVLRGRCLPYGEGITFWPIREMVREAAAILDEHSPEEAKSRIRSMLEPRDDSELIATRVAQAIGLASGVAGGEEIAWGIRRWFETLAERGPLVLVVDDIQWAEENLRALLADLPRLSARAPIMLVCLARTELLDEAPGWAPTIRLEALDESEGEALVREMLGGLAEPGLVQRVTAASGGNPLFAREIAAMLQEEDGLGSGKAAAVDVEIPPTLTMLLEARLDRLPERERAALERGSVEGEVFHRGAVVELSSSESRPSVRRDIEGLIRRGFLRHERAEFVNEAAFRFEHVLVRDAAYRGIPKKDRAQLHQDFATWLEAKGAGRIVEYEEIIGYHLEQAYRYREALGPVGVDERLLAEAAAERLARAGRRALNLGAAAAAANLLERATALLPSRDPARVEMLLVLSHAIEVGIGDSPRAVSVADEAARAAEALGDEALQAHATITGLVLRMRTDTASAVAQAEAAAAKALPIFEARGDAAGLAKTWRLLAWPPYLKAHAAETEQALERAVAHGRDAGDRWEESENLSYLAENAWRGPRPIEDALVRCDQILAQAGRDRRLKASIDQHRAILESWRGDFDKARALVADSRASFAELGLKGDMPFSSWVAAQVELAADDPLAAESELRRALEAPGDEESTLTAALGESLYRQERFNDARACADRAERAAALLRDGVQARGLGARLLARAGLSADAELAAREAVERADSSDYLYLRANALMDLAEVLRLALRMDEAVASVTAALKLYEQKGATASAARARALLDQL